jgi:hypothetical protein
MPPSSLNQIIPVLQVAIGPVILISGVGLLRLSSTFATFSMLLVSVLIVTVFVAAWLHGDAPWLNSLMCVIFVACLASLFVALVAFIRDINLSLHALKLELNDNKMGVD